jgi:nitrogen regulatory protein P-II 1
MTIGDITAWAGQRKITLQRRGIPISYDLIHRAKVEIDITDDQLERVVNTIIDTTRTGQPEDGRITVLNLEQVINISTLQKGENALEG